MEGKPRWEGEATDQSTSPMASKQVTVKGRGGKRKQVVLTVKEKIDVYTCLKQGESRKALMAGVQRGHEHPVRLQGPQGPAALVLRQF